MTDEDVQIVKFSPLDAVQLAGKEKSSVAIANMTTGPAYSIFKKGKLIGCGGLRIDGIGEAWALFDEGALETCRKTILRVTKEQMELMMREHEVWRLYADTELRTWMRHLDFSKRQIFVR